MCERHKPELPARDEQLATGELGFRVLGECGNFGRSGMDIRHWGEMGVHGFDYIVYGCAGFRQ